MLKIFFLFVTFLVLSQSENCDIGFYFDGSSCSSCNERCSNCLSQLICTMCKQQAFLSINEGGLTCKYCEEIIQGCLFCQSDSTCQTCLPGYSLKQGFCHSVPGGSISIAQCQSFQVQVHGKCFSSIAYCVNYSDDGTCAQCQTGTVSMQGYCIPNTLTENFASSSCGERQYKSDGLCKDIGIECLTFTNDGNCTQCSSQFTLFRGMCVQTPQKGSQILISYIPQKKTTNQVPLNNQQKNQNSSPLTKEQNSQPTHQIAKQKEQSEKIDSNLEKQNASCDAPCKTCSHDSKFCLSCLDGFTTVDEMPGICFQL